MLTHRRLAVVVAIIIGSTLAAVFSVVGPVAARYRSHMAITGVRGHESASWERFADRITESLPSSELRASSLVTRTRAFGYRHDDFEIRLQDTSTTSGDIIEVTVRVLGSGWPATSFEGVQWSATRRSSLGVRGLGRWEAGVWIPGAHLSPYLLRLIPRRALLSLQNDAAPRAVNGPGLAINGAFYAALVAALLLVAGVVRRLARRIGGRCERCGYKSEPARRCPECGSPPQPASRASSRGSVQHPPSRAPIATATPRGPAPT
jgi:hypothetical protein